MNSPATSDSSSSSSSGSYSSWSPSSKSSSSSPVHPASLVDPSTHSPELMQLVDIDLSEPVIEYVVACVTETVNHAFGRPSTFRSPRAHKFTNFVSNILSRAEIAAPTLLVTLVYVARARSHLSIALEQWALERVFLGALIVASKYTQDSTLRNVHWAMVTGVFGKGDIGRMEREFLEVLDWELGVSEADVMAHHEGLAAAAAGKPWVAPLPVLRVKKQVVESEAEEVHHHAVPELEPSSPHSSAGSFSPRTPISHDVSPLDIDMAMEGAASPTCTLVESHPMDTDVVSPTMPAPAPAAPAPAPTSTIPPSKKSTSAPPAALPAPAAPARPRARPPQAVRPPARVPAPPPDAPRAPPRGGGRSVVRVWRLEQRSLRKKNKTTPLPLGVHQM
ncbi:hypothetical protein B0H14DRAFT_2510494 [Mycena olivaceomarginata]|nr:hypothetical protein B0H14DRAFT_2510494 [Mycena olivaceomarginata]